MESYYAAVVVGLLESEIKFEEGKEIEDLHEFFIEEEMEYLQIATSDEYIFGRIVSTTVEHFDSRNNSCSEISINVISTVLKEAIREFKRLGIVATPKVYSVLACA